MEKTRLAIIIIVSAVVSLAIATFVSVTLTSNQSSDTTDKSQFLSAKIYAIRAENGSEYYVNPAKRALFASVPQSTFDNNPKLTQLINNADSAFEISSKHLGMSGPSGLVNMDLTQNEADRLLSALTSTEKIDKDYQGNSGVVAVHQYFHLDIDGKLYDVTISKIILEG